MEFSRGTSRENSRPGTTNKGKRGHSSDVFEFLGETSNTSASELRFHANRWLNEKGVDDTERFQQVSGVEVMDGHM